jgi:hypothetical protein
MARQQACKGLGAVHAVPASRTAWRKGYDRDAKAVLSVCDILSRLPPCGALHSSTTGFTCPPNKQRWLAAHLSRRNEAAICRHCEGRNGLAAAAVSEQEGAAVWLQLLGW